MTYWIGLLGLLIGLFSPAVGALFVISAAGRYFVENPKQINSFFTCWFIICGFLMFIYNIQALDLIFGAGLSCLLFFYMIKKEYGLNLIFMSLLLLNSAFIAIRQLLYSTFIATQYTESVDEVVNMLSNRFQESSEQYLLFLEMVEMSKDFYLKYSPGIWIFTMLLCLMLGYYFLSKKSKELVSLRYYQTHLYVIYSLILALVIAVFSEDYRIYAINYLIALVPLFLMQGLAVLKFKIGKWFENSKILLVIAILSLILNPYIVLFISVIGLFDNWFDFRSLSKPEDLNESNTNGNP